MRPNVRKVVAALLERGERKLALALYRASQVITAKAHFKPSQWVDQYEDEVAMLAENNFGPWKDPKQAEQFVKKAIRQLAQEKYNDVIESFKGKDDIKYMVETHMYADDPDPYKLEPPDPHVGKAIEKFAQRAYGSQWKKYVVVRTAKKAGLDRQDPKGWVMSVEGLDDWDYVTAAFDLQKFLRQAGWSDAYAEPYDHVTIMVFPQGQ